MVSNGIRNERDEQTTRNTINSGRVGEGPSSLTSYVSQSTKHPPISSCSSHSNEHLRSNDKRTCPGNSDTCTLVRKVTHQSHGWWWDWEEQQEQRDQVMIATHKVESVYLRKLVEKSLSLNYYYYYYGLANEGSEC